MLVATTLRNFGPFTLNRSKKNSVSVDAFLWKPVFKIYALLLACLASALCLSLIIMESLTITSAPKFNELLNRQSHSHPPYEFGHWKGFYVNWIGIFGGKDSGVYSDLELEPNVTKPRNRFSGPHSPKPWLTCHSPFPFFSFLFEIIQHTHLYSDCASHSSAHLRYPHLENAHPVPQALHKIHPNQSPLPWLSPLRNKHSNYRPEHHVRVNRVKKP